MRRPLPRALAWIVAGVFLLLHLPVVVLVAYSFNAARYSAAWSGFTLHWYAALLERPDILRALRLSLVVASTSTLLATVLGTLVAMALARARFRGSRLIEGGLYLPIVTPEIVAGISLLILFAAVQVPLGVGTVIVAHTAFCLPFVAVVVLARLRGMDRTLEEAALVLGADELTAFRRVTLPQLAPGILAGALLAFTLSLDDFVITFFVAGPGATTLPVLVYSMVRRGVEPTINAVSTLLVVLTTLAVGVAARVDGARRA
ncbi:MAG TPA: ABC transporter permease [Gemmatimonadales bacterium]|nr:ABC transporter permease [Gemmatimonadales bacterium]